jgi:hypothetical protein
VAGTLLTQLLLSNLLHLRIWHGDDCRLIALQAAGEHRRDGVVVADARDSCWARLAIALAMGSGAALVVSLAACRPHRNLASPVPDVMATARVKRERGGRPGALPMAEQERRLFLLIPALL